MSGQPLKNASDASKFREQYQKNLELRIKLNKVDENANKLYKSTGQLPLELLDTRTANEKLSDIESIKVDVRNKLNEISDAQEANKIAQSLSNNELIFYAQSANEINSILKPKYRFGIYAEIFIPFLQRYMNDTASANGVMSGLQQNSKNILLNAENYAKTLTDEQQLLKMKSKIENNIKGADLKEFLDRPIYKEFIKQIDLSINQLSVPYTPVQLVENINKDGDQNRRLKNFEDLNNVFQEFPTKQIIDNELDKILRIINTRDINSISNSLKKIIQKITPPLETQMILNRLVSIEPKGRAGRPKGSSNKPKIRAQEVIPEALAEALPEKQISGMGIRINQRGKPPIIKKIRKRLDHLQPSDIDYTKGIELQKRFVPIGRFVINTHQLNKDIVAIKRPSGSTILDFPSQKVSSRLGDVIRIISGGQIPSFENYEELNDTERAYLYKLAKESRIIDRLSIPAPNKNELDKEIDDFEKMRGQILAGNDNKDLVKKFKLLLLKLTYKNIIPKQQSREILFELTSLGF